MSKTSKNSGKQHGGGAVDHTKQLPRLRRIEGQVRGLHQMIETERNCLDIAHQISAVVAALRRVQGDMLHDHLMAIVEAAIAGNISDAQRRRLVEEVNVVIARFI